MKLFTVTICNKLECLPLSITSHSRLELTRVEHLWDKHSRLVQYDSNYSRKMYVIQVARAILKIRNKLDPSVGHCQSLPPPPSTFASKAGACPSVAPNSVRKKFYNRGPFPVSIK